MASRFSKFYKDIGHSKTETFLKFESKDETDKINAVKVEFDYIIKRFKSRRRCKRP